MARSTTSPREFIEAWKSFDEEKFLPAVKRDASRMSNELQRWKKYQILVDPEDMLDEHRDDSFIRIEQARLYLGRIFERSRVIRNVDFEKQRAEYQGDIPKKFELEERIFALEAEQFGYYWRIYKIYSELYSVIGPQLHFDPNKVDPDAFREFEYDPEKS